jgi:hypothetical protein
VGDLIETLQLSTKWLDRYRDGSRTIGEENTKAGLIEPILEALGWDIHDPDEVCREYRRLSSDKPVDYALLLLRTARLFVEAKGVGANLDDPKWANQIIEYATAAGVEWVALTNGAEWRIYNAHAPVPIEQKLFRKVRIDDTDEALRTLPLLSKENAGENRIEALWKVHFVDRRVRQVLVELFNSGEPAKELVAAVRRRVPSLTLHEVRESLARARATFEFPVVEEQEWSRPVVGHQSRRSDGRVDQAATSEERGHRVSSAEHSMKYRVSSAERSMKLRDLIAVGRLAPGDVFKADYWGEHHTAILLDDGRVSYQGAAYQTPSAAGEAVKKAMRGQDIPKRVSATDGWGFWRAEDRKTGQMARLRRIRRSAAAPSP